MVLLQGSVAIVSVQVFRLGPDRNVNPPHLSGGVRAAGSHRSNVLRVHMSFHLSPPRPAQSSTCGSRDMCREGDAPQRVMKAHPAGGVGLFLFKYAAYRGSLIFHYSQMSYTCRTDLGRLDIDVKTFYNHLPLYVAFSV